MLVLAPGEPPGARRARRGAGRGATLVAARGAWLAEREELLERGRQARRAPPARAASSTSTRRCAAAAPARRPAAPRALALGSAVHRIMELCDLHDEASIARLAAGVARDLGQPDLAEEAAALAARLLASAPVRAAASAAAADPGAVYRELPIGVLIDDIVVSGAVDLLYRDGDEWVVVDYKTDRGADDGVLRERYTPQGAAYAVAVEKATGERVREVVFVAARADGLAVTVAVDDDLRALARSEVGAAAAAGRAVRGDELADD